MSMSQEEIEALMNGLDISENDSSTNDDDTSAVEDDSEKMSENDIADLIAQTDLSSANVEEESKEEETSSNAEEKSEETDLNKDVDELLNSLDNNDSDTVESDIVEPSPSNTEEENDFSDSDIDELLNSTNEEDSDDEEESSISSDEIDSIINGIVSEDENKEETKVDDVPVDTSEIDDLIAGLEKDKEKDKEEDKSSLDDEDYLKGLDLNLDAESIDDMDKVEEEPIVNSSSSSKKNSDVVNVDKINIPNQLGEVANDSEEKATKIFDALSYILEDNEELRKTTKSLDGFIQSQHKMLEMLNKKFPNVKEFSENLELVKSLLDKPQEIQERLHNRDKELFDTMELMQFHDINRQKIERVMGLVINLSRQLNAIFEDESNSVVLPGANHLPGDKSSDLVNSDDLESLIAEFGK
jgi:hypothetical protein